MSTQQTCKACGRADPFDFNVPDEVWTATVPEHLQQRVVCLACFDAFAAERRVEYSWALHRLYFAGLGGSFVFETVGSAPAGVRP